MFWNYFLLQVTVGKYHINVGHVNYIEEESVQTYIIIGCVVGGAILLAVVVVMIKCCVSKRRNDQSEREAAETRDMEQRLQNSQMPTTKNVKYSTGRWIHRLYP